MVKRRADADPLRLRGLRPPARKSGQRAEDSLIANALSRVLYA
jgi:hypothetical protein